MRHTIVKQMPTGPNPLPPLEEFVVKKTMYDLSKKLQCSTYRIEIDPTQGVGFFESATYRGQFWLIGFILTGADHLLPRAVQNSLVLAGYTL